MRALSNIGKEALQSGFMRGAFTWRLPPASGCALTFDDGPNEDYTPRVLELLARHGIKASFFVIGESALRAPALVRRIADEGHCIASHTYSHRDLPSLDRADLKEELDRCRSLIHDMTGVDTTMVRPPRGRISVGSLVRMSRWGYRLIHWSRTYSDYLRDGTEKLLNRVRTTGMSPGDIALFHDNNVHTLEVLERVLPEWRASGLTFTRLY